MSYFGAACTHQEGVDQASSNTSIPRGGLNGYRADDDGIPMTLCRCTADDATIAVCNVEAVNSLRYVFGA
ncbi:hypothetical protein RM96_21090 [Cupriavidus sp. IDO]|nr:hypothetical protein RM96_21090 [Cupriavidus sp. IDO]